MSTQAEFDLAKFGQATFTPRTEEVAVPALADFFNGDGERVFKIRGLTANEIAIANEAATRNSRMDSLVKAMTAMSKTSQVEEFRKAFGVTDDVTADIVKRIEHFCFGCVEPKFEKPMAVKFAEAFPIEFFDITNKILTLSGRGMEAIEKKPIPSGEKVE